MAAAPMPDQGNPQGAAPSGAAQGQQTANPLQETLGKLAMIARQLGTQNTVIQGEMQEVSAKLVQALQKVSQASSGPPQQLAAPPQQ